MKTLYSHKLLGLIGGGNLRYFFSAFLLFALGTILPSLAVNQIQKNSQKDSVTTDSVQTDSVYTDSVQTVFVPSPDSIKIYDELGDLNNQY